MPKPVRIKRSRAKGSHLLSPNGLPVVCVSRPSKWGNPFPLPSRTEASPAERERARARSVALFRQELARPAARSRLPFTREDVRRDLRGKNLACWCPLDGPCHADVLLEVANR